MRGKYQKKKKSNGGRIAVILTAAVLILLGVLWFFVSRDGQEAPAATEPRETTASTDAPAEPSPNASTESTIPFKPEAEGVAGFSLEGGLEITRFGQYIGLYMEDGSDEFVDNVMMILVQNTGDQSVQYARITLTGPNGDAVFSLSTLLPGQSMVVLESARKPYFDGDIYTEATLDNVALFSETPSLLEDRLQIQPLEGGFNITNISGTDISGEIAVYFKDTAGDTFYGGITYVARIPGLAADEVKQIMSANFTEKGSRVVFVGITE